MKLPANKKWLGIGLAVIVLIAASGVLTQSENDIKTPTAREKSASGRTKPAGSAEELKLALSDLAKTENRVSSKTDPVDIFASKSWYVPPPPPPPAAPLPPPKPTAPPLPYAFMGSFQGKDGKLAVFLTKGDRVFSVSVGDVLENTYRVEEIASGQLVLIYLPLNIRQTMSIGEAS